MSDVEETSERTEKQKMEAERKKLIRVRGGHKSFFTRLSGKVDDTLANSIYDDVSLSEAEGLLSSLNHRCNIVQKLDSEIILSTEDEADLDVEMQAQG